MAEIALDRFDIVPGMNGGHGIRMPQVVKARVRPPDGCNHFFEGTINGGFRQVQPAFIGKHKVTLHPCRTGSQPVLQLRQLSTPQLRHDKRPGGNGPHLAALCADERISVHPCFLMQLHLLINSQRSAFKVHAVPCQPQHLALAQTGKQGDDKKVFEAVPPNGFEKIGNLGLVKGLDGRFFGAGKSTQST